MNRQGLKKALIVVHDLAMTGPSPSWRRSSCASRAAPAGAPAHLPLFLPPFIAFAGVIYWFSHLYKSKWRLVPARPLQHLPGRDHPGGHPAGASTTSSSRRSCAALLLRQDHHRPLLADPDVPAGRPEAAFRYLKYARSRHTLQRDSSTPTLLLGRSDIEVIRAPSRPARSRRRSPRASCPTVRRSRQSIRGVPVLGTFADLDQVIQDFHERGTPIRRLLATRAR